MNNNKIPVKETIALVIGEAAVSLLLCLGFLVFKKFHYSILTGALLGSMVAILNFLFLSISVNRAFDKILAENELPKKDDIITDINVNVENTEEDEENTENDAAARFAAEHQAQLQNSIKISYFLRNITMVVALVLAMVTGWFNVIATIVPLLMFKPILTVYATVERRKNT